MRDIMPTLILFSGVMIISPACQKDTQTLEKRKSTDSQSDNARGSDASDAGKPRDTGTLVHIVTDTVPEPGTDGQSDVGTDTSHSDAGGPHNTDTVANTAKNTTVTIITAPTMERGFLENAYHPFLIRSQVLERRLCL